MSAKENPAGQGGASEAAITPSSGVDDSGPESVYVNLCDEHAAELKGSAIPPEVAARHGVHTACVAAQLPPWVRWLGDKSGDSIYPVLVYPMTELPRMLTELVPRVAALLGADIEKAQGLADAAAQGEVCTVANDNDPSQVVISGHRGAIERAIELVKDHGIKRGILLPVSAPFHCPLMQPAADAMAQALADASLQAPLVPVYANVAAAPVADAETIKALLVEQVTGRVRWRESVVAMFDNGVHEFVEFGGKVLAPMVKRSAQDANATSVISMDDIEALMKGL